MKKKLLHLLPLISVPVIHVSNNVIDPERRDRRPYFRFHLFCKSAHSGPLLYYPFHFLLYPYNENDACIVKLIPNNGIVDYLSLVVEYEVNKNVVGYRVENLRVITPLLQRWEDSEYVGHNE